MLDGAQLHHQHLCNFYHYFSRGSVLNWLKPSQKMLKIDETHFLVVTHRFELIFNEHSFDVFLSIATLKPSQKMLKIDETHFLALSHCFELIFNKNSFYVL